MIYDRGWDVCWNGFQMDPGGSKREVTEESCKVHMEGAVKPQFILEEFPPALSM